MKGKLIVIEGIDGSGKTTQLELLKQTLKSQKKSFRSMKFPQYSGTFFGKTIARFLRGEIGELKTINPYLISMVYAMDRAEARDKMYGWLNNGKTILLDRYVTSNMAHQCGRLPLKERKKYLAWLDELEYKINNVPREDVVIYLHMPYEKALELMEGSDRSKRQYAKGKQKDMVEGNLEYLRKSQQTYLYLQKRYKHWVKIDCLDEKGNLKTREQIHYEIIDMLKKQHILS